MGEVKKDGLQQGDGHVASKPSCGEVEAVETSGMSRRNFIRTGAAVAGAAALGMSLNMKPGAALAQTHKPEEYVRTWGKSVFDHIPFGKDGLDQVYGWLDQYVAKNKGIATKKIIGKSYPGNIDVPAIWVTNKKIPDDNKQVAIVTLARHGQEAGTRVVGPEILQYLASDDAKDIRDNQVVIVVPVINPEGFIENKFNSLLTGLTKNERRVLGPFFKANVPDMIIDYHSLGRTEGSKYDRGDMECIVPANTTRWGIDEQVHLDYAKKMVEAAEAAGYPYEIHTLEDIYCYYFGNTDIGNLSWQPLKDKNYLLTTQHLYDGYDAPFVDDEQPEHCLQPVKGFSGYTNYTCGPAYRKWHCMVFGMETNHWSMTNPADIAISGMIPCRALLKMGSQRAPWEKYAGYPMSIVNGDHRVSIRALGKTAAARRASRIKLWNEKENFNLPFREQPDPETTIARVRYFGQSLPLEFALVLRMRQDPIKKITMGGKEVPFELFADNCSKHLYIPLKIEKPGTITLEIKHAKGNGATKKKA